MISVSISFSVKKNAVGLATITILSTMSLSDYMSAATSIFKASENFKEGHEDPRDFWDYRTQNVEKISKNSWAQYTSEKRIDCLKKEVLTYSNFGVSRKNQERYEIDNFWKGQKSCSQPKTIFMVFDKRLWEYDRTETCTFR